MFRNYFTVAFRNFWKNKIFSFINIAGLAIGISASLVIYLIVHYEFSFDRFHMDGGRIYRVVSNMHFPDQDFKNSGVPGPFPPAIRSGLPGIEESTQFWIGSQTKVAIPNESEKKSVFRKQEHIVFADNHYFKMFHYQWLAGSADNALKEPGKVVLAESRARNYFSYHDISDAIGQTIIYDDTVKAIVSGIVKDLDKTTDFTFKEFVSLPTIAESLKKNNGWDEWGSINSVSQFFIKLQKGIDPKRFQKELNALRKKYSEKKDYLVTDHALQPLNDIHFNADYDNFDQRLAHKPTLYGLLIVGAFLLLLGCINFINLTTAQAANRSKEIGIRKTMGSSKPQLLLQFLSETMLMVLFATALSIALTPWILKLFSDYIPEGLSFDLVKQPHVIFFILLMVLAVSLLSGFYPAMVLSRFKPVLVLKNQAYANTSQGRRVWIRKTLTVSQFVIAQFFIMATLVVGKQIRFTLNKDLGFKKEAIINFNTPFNFMNPDNKQFILQEKLKRIPEIQQLSLAGSPPASQNLSISTMKFKKDGKEIETSVEVKQADTSYFDLYKMKLLAGRNLQQSDTVREYVINEAYARFLGYKNPADIIGKQTDRGNGTGIPIVGVIANINTKSLHQAIQPLVFTSQSRFHTTFHIALFPQRENTDTWKVAINKIGKAWKEVYPDEDFKYTFFDESIAKFYEKEQQIARLLNWSAGLAIFISCLGLLGLVIYTTNQRMKEIGVRKVLGASVSQIVSLLSKDFMRLVVLAFVIAAPLVWLAMHRWLEDFAYRTTISWWIFLLSGSLMLVTALLVLSMRTIKAATANPVESLRTE